MRMPVFSSIFIAALLLLLPAHAGADKPLGAPNTTLLIESYVLDGNQSNNLGPAVQWVMENFWEAGACPEGESYQFCDTLRFGAALYNRPDCSPGSKLVVAPQEDGALPVQDFVTSNDTSYFCGQQQRRHLAQGLYGLQEELFDGLLDADPDEKDKWFENPHLTLAIISDVPRAGPGTGQTGNQVRDSLIAACDLFVGYPGDVPPMPLWTMVAREHSEEAVRFAGILSAAGGTGHCCDTDADEFCDPHDEADQIDVCNSLTARSESALRQDLSDDRYRCGFSTDSWITGAMDFETTGNNLPQITCHLNGLGPGHGNNPNVCDQEGRVRTDIFGKFACLRQLPRDFAPDVDVVQFCDASGCQSLFEEDGDFQFVDPGKSLIALSGQFCDALASGDGQVSVDPCPSQGLPCDTGLLGRCAQGVIECHEEEGLICRQLHFPMPEICNGRDDNCDGLVDNLDETVDDLPAQFQSRACFGNRVCVCPDGPERAHYGHDLMSFLDGQEGLCECRVALSADLGEGQAMPEGDEIPAPAACSSTRSLPTGPFLVVTIVLILFGVTRRLCAKRS